MDSDTPNPRDLSPQDPARFSKPKSEPPILDLEAEKPEASADSTTAEPKADAPKHDTLHVAAAAAPKRHLPISGFIGGVIGGGAVVLLALGYASLTDSTSRQITALQTSLSQKAERGDVAPLEKRIAQLEATLGETKSAIASATKTTAPVDADVVKRIATLEDAFQNLNPASPVAAQPQDLRALRLALILSLRDAIRNEASPAQELAALDKTGETSANFITLKTSLSSALTPYDEIRAEILTLTKAASPSDAIPTEQAKPASHLSSFFSQLVTVRPATPTPNKTVATDAAYATLLEAVDQDDAKAALVALNALPDGEHQKFKSVESELKRRVTVEATLTHLLDDALEAIAKGNAP